MTEATQNSSTSSISVGQWCLQNRHFLIVATVLVLVWAGWTSIRYVFDMVVHKEAVAWPAGVEVDPVEFRMLSLANSFGPDNRFERAGDGELFFPSKDELFVTDSGDILEGINGRLYYRDRSGHQMFTGELSEVAYKKNGQRVLDDEPDGERTIGDEVLESLAIGTPLDASNFKDRKSTWYVSRTYIDRKKTIGEKYSQWQLDVTYYTGTMDKAPHFPERCLEAGGMFLGKKGNVTFSAPGAPGPWGEGPVTCRFVEFSNPQIDRANLRVQYYVYSLNGYPERSWEAVRLKMASVFGKYAFFAKIQFNPANEIRDLDEAKQASEEFVQYMLPEVLKALPMPEDIKRLESGAP